MITETVSVNRIELEVTHAGTGRVVLLLHGFPEHAHSWRHQVDALADAGYHAIAPNQRGYGASTRPEQIADYSIHHLVGDAVALCDHYGAEAPVVVGHDWGAFVAWHAALMRPDRFAGVVGMSVPYVPRLDKSTLELVDERRNGGFHYIRYFQEPGVAEAELDGDVDGFMRAIMWGASGDETGATPPDPMTQTRMVDPTQVPDGLPDWLREEDLAIYVEAFRAAGFTGPLNWYRNFHRNFELTAAWSGLPITIPSLFIGGSADPVLRGPEPGDPSPMLPVMEHFCTDHRGTVVIDGEGHWIQQEDPEATNAALLTFLASL